MSFFNFPRSNTQAPISTTQRTTQIAVATTSEPENTPRSVEYTIVRKIPGVIQHVTVPSPPLTDDSERSTGVVEVEKLSSEEEQEQAKSAYYNFETSVHDTINDHEHVRKEVREGLALKGMYSYSDGFFKRTVHYEADEGGYRVVKEEIQPISEDGPKFNPKGKADVKTTTKDYSITVDDFRLNKQQELILKDTGL